MWQNYLPCEKDRVDWFINLCLDPNRHCPTIPPDGEKYLVHDNDFLAGYLRML